MIEKTISFTHQKQYRHGNMSEFSVWSCLMDRIWCCGVVQVNKEVKFHWKPTNVTELNAQRNYQLPCWPYLAQHTGRLWMNSCHYKYKLWNQFEHSLHPIAAVWKFSLPIIRFNFDQGLNLGVVLVIFGIFRSSWEFLENFRKLLKFFAKCWQFFWKVLKFSRNCLKISGK